MARAKKVDGDSAAAPAGAGAGKIDVSAGSAGSVGGLLEHPPVVIQKACGNCEHCQLKRVKHGVTRGQDTKAVDLYPCWRDPLPIWKEADEFCGSFSARK